MSNHTPNILTTLKYWLVDHPTISNFEWRNGITFGASIQFLTITIITYLISIYLLCNSPIQRCLPSTQFLRCISAVHNTILVLLSSIMAVGGAVAALSQMPHPHWILCFPANQTPPRGPVFFWGYVFYLSKLLEFTDTLLIILRGNTKRRLSFLHVFHHSTVVFLCYLWLDTSQTLFPLGLVVNSTVHVVMYGYYLMCTVGVRPTWKRLVTNCQIVQFVFGFVVAGVSLYHHFFKEPCSGVWPSGCFNLAFNALLLYLFLNFHSTNYNKKEIICGDNEKIIKEKKV